MAEARYKNMWTFLIESNYEDANIASDMRCTVCTRILINAHNSVCGCRYCLECVKAYLDGKRRFCPGNTDECKTEELDIDSNIYPDHAMNHKISKLIVSCHSCGYKCELRNMEEHEGSCQKNPFYCPYVNVGCREKREVTDKIDEHLVAENKSHVRLLMTCIDRLESEIVSMKRDTVELRSEMAEMRLAREIDEARTRETNELVDQIKQEMANLRIENKLAKEENNSLKAEIEKYHTEYLDLVTTTEQRFTKIKTRKDIQLQIIELLTQKYNRCKDRFQDLELLIQKEREKVRIRFDEIRDKKARGLDDVLKCLLKMQIDVEIQNRGEFVWPIDEWATKRQAAKDGGCERIFSQVFYSHKNGYKMCLSIHPDGICTAKGTHVSVAFHLMRGPFDRILTWPCKRTVTLSIIDQQTGVDHISDIFTFDDFPKMVVWNQPASDRNTGFGNCKFIKQTELLSNRWLCQDDKIFIKCVVK